MRHVIYYVNKNLSVPAFNYDHEKKLAATLALLKHLTQGAGLTTLPGLSQQTGNEDFLCLLDFTC